MPVRMAIPDVDGGILGARYDVLVVEANVEDTCGMSLEASHGDEVVAFDVPNDARMVRRTGDHDSVIILQTKDRRLVVVDRDVVDGVAIYSAVHGRIVNRAGTVRFEFWRRVDDWTICRATDHLPTLVCLHVPDTDSAVTRAGDDLVLVELATIHRICVAIEVDGRGATVLPSSVNSGANLVHGLPILARGWFSLLELTNAGSAHHDWRWCDVHRRFELAKKHGTPDM